MTDIPEQVIDARLSIDTGTGGRYVELVERVAVPAGSDTEIVELSAIGRLVQSAAGRYGGTLAELVAPLREAVLALPDGELTDPITPQRVALETWRHAALCLLEHVVTGKPIDFQGQPVPDVVTGRLDKALFGYDFPRIVADAVDEVMPKHTVSDAVTEAIPRLRVFRHWQQVPVDVAALAHVNRVGHWYVRGVDQWRRTGPDGDETLHELRQMFVLGDMVAVDPQTGQPC